MDHMCINRFLSLYLASCAVEELNQNFDLRLDYTSFPHYVDTCPPRLKLGHQDVLYRKMNKLFDIIGYVE